MRSQTFGFHVETRQLFEGIFPHPFPEVQRLLRHHTHIFGDLYMIHQRSITFGSPDMDSGVSFQEFVLNAWDEEIFRTISLVHQACGSIDSIQRLEKMRQAFSFNWLKLQQSAAVAQIALGAMAGNETHMIMTIGWNDDAPEYDVHMASIFFQVLMIGLRTTKITYNSRKFWVESEMEPEIVSKRRKYGIRLDTVAKLEALKKLREKDRKENGAVTLTKTEACQQVGLTVITLRKYDRLLYDRWDDMKY